jgi:pimeloyl-ACP methyl ester carboxylesterase
MPHLVVNGSRIEYMEQGHGQPVVLLHSTGTSGKQWGALMDRLGADHRVLAPDLYGYGESAHWPGAAEFSLADETAIVHTLLERLHEPAHLVGHSYGGAVALHVARTHGDALRSLTLIEPVAFHLLRGGDEVDVAALGEVTGVAEMVARSLATGDYVGGFGRFVEYWGGPGAWAAIPPSRRISMAENAAKVALDFHATIHNPLQLDDFEHIAVPTLLMQGGATAHPTQRICMRLSRALRTASTRIVDGAGHMLPVTHRTLVNDMIVAHLRSNGAGRCSASA